MIFLGAALPDFLQLRLQLFHLGEHGRMVFPEGSGLRIHFRFDRRHLTPRPGWVIWYYQNRRLW
jgi:hypothetical protein